MGMVSYQYEWYLNVSVISYQFEYLSFLSLFHGVSVIVTFFWWLILRALTAHSGRNHRGRYTTFGFITRVTCI